MARVLTYDEIDREEWSKLVRESKTGTWFQTPEAYEFYKSLPELFRPFVMAISHQPTAVRDQALRGVCVGYVTVEKNPIKQFFTRRAIIIGGPALADDCTEDEVCELMSAVREMLQSQAIYIETRNLNDYSRWKGAFETAGFDYQAHLNFHVHTNQPWEKIEASIGKHRKKYIRLSLRDGATIADNPTIEQVHTYYDILLELYRTKVKMPLQPWSFFEKLYQCESCKYLLVLYEGQVIGGSICMLLTGHGVYEWYACGKDGVFKNIHPSSVTKYAGMKYAYENGYQIFDMMGAGKPEEEYAVRDFKAEFGGELVEYGRFLHVAKQMLYAIGKMGVRMMKNKCGRHIVRDGRTKDEGVFREIIE